MKRVLFPLLLLCLLPLQGCIATAVGIAGAGVATAVQSAEEIVEASYPYSYWCVFKATHVALSELAIPLDKVDTVKNGDIFFAKTEKYPLRVELQEVTESVVRVTVYAGKNMFQQDQATAQALVDTIQAVIDRNVTVLQ